MPASSDKGRTQNLYDRCQSTAELASWDRELLAAKFVDIEFLDEDFDLSMTGFEIEEIELLSDYRSSKSHKPETQVPATAEKAVSRTGDLWMIGDRHMLLCADSANTASYEMLLGVERADMVITDPPWNCPIQGHVSGLGKNQHREFVMASGELTREEFVGFLAAAMSAIERVSRSRSLHYYFCDWRIVGDVLSIGKRTYQQLITMAVWAKTNAGMGSFLRSQHELTVILKKGRRAHVNNVNLVIDGRNRSNVWSFPGASAVSYQSASYPALTK